MIDLEQELRGGLVDAANLVSVSDDSLANYRNRSADPARQRSSLRVAVSLAAVVAVTAAIVIGAVALTSRGGGGHHPVQVVDGGPITLAPLTPISTADLTASATILTERLSALGVHNVTIEPAGSVLQARVPNLANATLIAFAGSRGVLQLRHVLSLLPVDRQVPGTVAPTSPRAAESPTLTAAFLRSYQDWSCPKQPNPTRGDAVASDYIIGCDLLVGQKYLLAPTAVAGSQVVSARPVALAQSGTGTQWSITLGLNKVGSSEWLSLTKLAYETTRGQPSTPGTCHPPAGCNAVAMVLDGAVLSAPTIQADGIAGGQLQILGSFSRESAARLAATIKYGPLPTGFVVTSSTASP